MIGYTKDTNNIVTITLDQDDRKDNVINHRIGEAFLPVLKHLQREKARGALRGVILTSSKKAFLAGGELDYLYHATDPEKIFVFAEGLKEFLRELERPGVPVVAALNGNAIGAGFDVALACHHRIAIDDPKVRLGNPEVHIGLMPGGGAVIRLMWLLGIEKAYPILTSGQRYSPREALKLGLIDELASDYKDMLERAHAWLLQTKEGRRPWDQQGGTIPGGNVDHPEVANVIRRFAAQIASETYNNYPALQAILNVMSEGSKVDFDTACRIESRHYTQLLRSKACKNMMKALWFDYNAIRYGLGRPKGFGRFRPKKVGIIGAGQMGSGIAFSCLQHGMEVVLKDVSRLIAQRGFQFVQGKLQQMINSGQLQPEEKEEIIRKIYTTEKAKDFEDCDLVIEAVFENPMVKQKVTKEAEAFMDEYSLLASNTLSIPITKLAKVSSRPENYIGLHFFHPADEVPLVEVIRGTETSDETVARAFDFVRAIEKIPIIVKDDWGFYAARVQNTYILEGITMLQEGYSPALIENIGRQTGMPKGALSFADDLGLELVFSYEQQAAEHYGNKYIQHPAVDVLRKMITELERKGRSAKGGFYTYSDNGERHIWTALAEHFPPTKKQYDRLKLSERFLFAQVIEAIWCMQEGVIASVPAANLGSIHGWGFPAFKGGVIQYVVDYGLDAFLKKCKVYEKRYGQRFRVPKQLQSIIEQELSQPIAG